MDNNLRVKAMLRKNGIHQWQLAKELSVSEFTLCRRLRYTLSPETFDEMTKAIERIKEGNK